jgi:hypothetical protein
VFGFVAKNKKRSAPLYFSGQSLIKNPWLSSFTQKSLPSVLQLHNQILKEKNIIVNSAHKNKISIVLLAAIIAVPIYTYSTVSQAQQAQEDVYPGHSNRAEVSPGQNCKICVYGNGAEVYVRSPHRSWTFHSGNCETLINKGRTPWYLEYKNVGSEPAVVSIEHFW